MHISLPSVHDHNMKMPNVTFCGERKEAKTRFSFSLLTQILFLGMQPQESSPTFDKVSEVKSLVAQA